MPQTHADVNRFALQRLDRATRRTAHITRAQLAVYDMVQ